MIATQDLNKARTPDWYGESDCSLEEFVNIVEAETVAQLAFSAGTHRSIPLYDCHLLRPALEHPATRRKLQSEWATILREGAGVFALKHAFGDVGPVDEATSVFEGIVRRERESGNHGADHFAKAGTNDRVWNAQEKLCLLAPSVFARYFSNRFIQYAAEAWLGPGFQVNSQVNVVRPGGAAQQAHRDYHLGFKTVDEAQCYPAHAHTMSPFLILQGAVAHSDMPLESGPTKLLPFSQRYAPGYVAWRRLDFQEYFEKHYVQLPLCKGDVVFFNPALFHAAGANRTRDTHRMANLLQISSAFGRAMEVTDRRAMCKAIYPVLLDYRRSGRLNAAELDAVIAACAEGFPFPTNLDRDPPLNGLAPSSQQEILRHALDESWITESLAKKLDEQTWRRGG